MLERLESVDWSRLKHAYGPATDVPAQIRALASQDAKTREDARWQLYGNIFHQGTRYEATPHAVPFLYELLREPTVREKHEIVTMLVSLAIGYDESHLPDGINPVEFRQQLKREEDDLSAEGRSERDEYAVSPAGLIDCYDAVLSGADALINLLDANDEELRCAAAYALAWFPEAASTSLPRLRESIVRSSMAVERATAIIASGLIARNLPAPPDLSFIASYLDQAHPQIVRTAAAIALAREPLSPEIMHALVGLLQVPDSQADAIQRLHFNEGKIRGLVSLVLSKYGRSQRGEVVETLCQVLKNVNSYESIDVTVAILGLIVDAQGRSLQEIGFANLDETQKLALNSIADYGGWSSCGGFANYDLLMADYRLPSSQERLYLFLGREIDAASVSNKWTTIFRKPWWQFW
jgi:hypothetical protein